MPTCLEAGGASSAYRERMTLRRALAALGLSLAAVAGLAACAGMPDGGATTGSASATASGGGTPTLAITGAPFPM